VNNLSQDAARHSFHLVGIINEHTVIRSVVLDQGTRAGLVCDSVKIAPGFVGCVQRGTTCPDRRKGEEAFEYVCSAYFSGAEADSAPGPRAGALDEFRCRDAFIRHKVHAKPRSVAEPMSRALRRL